MKRTKGPWVLVFVVAVAAAAMSLAAQAPDRPSDIIGLALVGHQVADLDRSIRFFEAVDFKLVEGPGNWTVDKELNNWATHRARNHGRRR